MNTLWQRVHEHADGPAVIDEAGTHTYGDLVGDATRLANWLADQGVGAGDVVAVQLPNRYETVVVALAVFARGAVLNPLLPNYRANELGHAFRAAPPKVVFSPATYRDFDHESLIRGLTDATHVVVGDLPLTGDPTTAHGGAEPSAVSELIFTSGTEATPKGILHTEESTNAGVESVREALLVGPRDVVWMPSPLGHSTGFNFGARFALYHGLPLVLQDRWDPSTAIELIERFGCTYTLAATTFLQDVVTELERRGDRLDGMSRFCCGGAPVPPELVARADAVGIGVLRLYGSTEALVVTVNRPDTALDLRQHTDGRPVPGAEVRLADDGEIEVRTTQGAIGYLNDPERTAATFLPGGWVRSGDLGVLDVHGHLTIVGRKKELVIRGGMNIAPREIEELLLRVPGVDRCAVVGKPDARLGESVCAFVTVEPDASVDLGTAVEHLTKAGLAAYKLPQELRVVDALPMTASGKIQKHVLREWLQ